MDDEVRLTKVERRVDYIIRLLSSFTCSAAIAELSRRVVTLEESFKESSFNMDNGIRNVYRQMKEEDEQRRKEEEERLRKEERMRQESEFKKMARDTFEYVAKAGDRSNEFRVKDKNIPEISPDCLYGLSLLMKEYKEVSLYECFKNCKNLKHLEFPPDFDTSNVSDMRYMYQWCSSLSTLNLSIFNTSNVQNMHCMFEGCSNLSTLDLSSFDTSNVIDMCGMFNMCNSLSRLDLSMFNTSNVQNMYWMFHSCSSLSTLDLSKFDTNKVTDIAGMFSGCSRLKDVKYNRDDSKLSNTLSER